MTACSAPDRRRTAVTCPEDQLGRLTACCPFSRAVREVAGKFIRSAAYPPVRPSVQDDRVDDGRHEVLLEHARGDDSFGSSARCAVSGRYRQAVCCWEITTGRGGVRAPQVQEQTLRGQHLAECDDVYGQLSLCDCDVLLL